MLFTVRHLLPAGEALFEVAISEEGRNMWAVHLERREWRAAFRAARDQVPSCRPSPAWHRLD